VMRVKQFTVNGSQFTVRKSTPPSVSRALEDSENGRRRMAVAHPLTLPSRRSGIWPFASVRDICLLDSAHMAQSRG
jgi:hypothetical protein